MKDYEDEAFDDIERAQQRKVATGVTDGSGWRKRQIAEQGEPVALENTSMDNTQTTDKCTCCKRIVPLTDAPLYLSNLVNALDDAFVPYWHSTHHWAKQLDEARDYLAAHGIKE